MTATSTLSRPAGQRVWSRVQRTLVVVFVIAVFAVAAFAAGRASIDAHDPAAVIPQAPSGPAAPAPVPSTGVPCHLVGHPC